MSTRGPMGQRLWTEEEDQYLRENYKTKSWEEMAEKLGRSPGSIQTHAQHLMLSRKMRLIDHHAEIVQMAKQGLTAGEVAERMGVNVASIYSYGVRNHINFVNHRIKYPKNR